MKFLPKKSCDKDDFHSSRDTALPYSPLSRLHGPQGLVFPRYYEIFGKYRQLLAQEQGIFICLKLLLSVEMNKRSSPLSFSIWDPFYFTLKFAVGGGVNYILFLQD